MVAMEQYEHKAFKSDRQCLIENKDMCKGIGFSDCPNGWSRLVRKLFEDIRDACEKHQCALPRVLQVKSKFGRLCFYLDNDYTLFDRKSSVGIKVMQLIQEAENKSETICEISGLPGFPHVNNGWFATLSEKKAKELGYTKRLIK
jgi:hypothetical protein